MTHSSGSSKPRKSPASKTPAKKRTDVHPAAAVVVESNSPAAPAAHHSPPASPPGNPPKNQTDVSRTVTIIAQYLGGGVVLFVIVYFLAGLLFDGILASFFRLLGLAAAIGIASAWGWKSKMIHLRGEEDQWYVVRGWNRRVQGFLRSGFNRITPLQIVDNNMVQIAPIFIRHDIKGVHNQSMDRFDVHMRVNLLVDPSKASGADARWLIGNYPDKIAGMVKGMMEDIAKIEVRRIDRFTKVMETDTEQILREQLAAKLIFLEGRGVTIMPNSILVDIHIPDELIAQRLKTRAEFTTLQAIRDVANDMGISTDELLIQQVLQRLPHLSGKNAHREIARILHQLGMQGQPTYRQTPPPPPPSAAIPEAVPPIPDQVAWQVEEPTAETPLEENPPPNQQARPRGYVEGHYSPIDDSDPDSDGSQQKGIFSPF